MLFSAPSPVGVLLASECACVRANVRTCDPLVRFCPSQVIVWLPQSLNLGCIDSTEAASLVNVPTLFAGGGSDQPPTASDQAIFVDLPILLARKTSMLLQPVLGIGVRRTTPRDRCSSSLLLPGHGSTSAPFLSSAVAWVVHL